MAVFSYHLAELPRLTTARALVRPPTSASTPGLRHVECMALMRLGAPVVSPSRLQLRRMAMFAYWADEAAIDEFLAGDELGRRLAAGWHVRMTFLRRWESLAALPDLPRRHGDWSQDEPVVAVTVTRMRVPADPALPPQVHDAALPPKLRTRHLARPHQHGAGTRTLM